MALVRLRISDTKCPIEQVCGLTLISKLKTVSIPLFTGGMAHLVWQGMAVARAKMYM